MLDPDRGLIFGSDAHRTGGLRLTLGLAGFAQDGRPLEVFCHGGKVGSSMDLILDDACVALSLLLQHDVEPRDLGHSMGRLGDGGAASIIDALVDLVSSSERERAK